MDARKSLHAAGLGPVAVAATWSVADRLGVDVADIEAIPGGVGRHEANERDFVHQYSSLRSWGSTPNRLAWRRRARS
jgi:hypothetical protein